MANWRFGAFPKLPYSTMQQLNLDWILDRIRRFLPDTGTKGQVLTRTKDGAAWVDPEAASGTVSSVNGKTGAVVLTASDVGALPSSYQAPVTSVNGMTGDVVISGGGSVDSVNGKTGEVVLTAADVGALPESYVPPAAPVQSVNGQTGAVQLIIPDSTSDLTNDSGFITAAQAAAAAPVQSVNGQTGAVTIGFGTESTFTLPQTFTHDAIVHVILLLNNVAGGVAYYYISRNGARYAAYLGNANGGLYSISFPVRKRDTISLYAADNIDSVTLYEFPLI